MRITQKSILVGVLALLFSFQGFTQNKIYLDKNNSCSYAEELGDTPEAEYYGYYPSDKAVKVMEKILKAASLSATGFELKVANVKNAVATVEGGRRYILYSQQFMSQMGYNTQNDWVVYSILAHEIGHHILGHNFKETDPEKRKQMELQADEFSGAILRAMCATEEDALAAISTLSNVQLSNKYPPVSARKEMIANSWFLKDAELKDEGRDPCNATINLNFGSAYGKANIAENAKAQITEEEMIISYDAPPVAGKFYYKSFLATPRYSSLIPSSIEWVSDPSKPGNNRSVIWHFAKDGYTREQVLKPQGLGIAVFEAKKRPDPVKAMEYSYAGGAILAGTASLIYSSHLRSEALDPYDNTYKEIRDPNASVYQGSNLSRTQLYNDSNKKYRNSQAYRNAGIVIITGGVALLIQKLRKHKKSKVGHLYVGDGKDWHKSGHFF